MLKAGIINRDEKIEIKNEKVIEYLKEIMESNSELKNEFESFKRLRLVEYPIIEFFVRYLGYIVIFNETVYYSSDVENENLDKVRYVKARYKLEKLQKVIKNGDRFVSFQNPIQQEIERIGFEHSISPENELAFWYPKTASIGFKTPKTLITSFTDGEAKAIAQGKYGELNEQEITERIRKANYAGKVDLDGELFVRLGVSSNKFNFETCHLKGIEELYPKLKRMLSDMYFKLEWQQHFDLVLREFIKTSYQRDTIYHGMPLNTEFRVFYDFDTNKVLGIFNYWDKDTMLDNLYNEQDLMTFASSTFEIEEDFKRLYSYLEEEIKSKMPNAKLAGRWSVDFLWDGQNFVLIDMAHAECSYYYEKVLSRGRLK